MQPQTIVGTIYRLGVHTLDKVTHEYEVVEIETTNGIVELPTVLVTTKVARCFTPGRRVALSYSPMKTKNGKMGTIVLGAYSFDEKRTYFDDEAVKFRSGITVAAVIFLLLVPIGLCFFVVPGLWFAWKAYQAFRARDVLPTEDELRASVDALARHHQLEAEAA